MNEPSTSHEFKRYIWEDFSVRRARNRVKAEQDYQEWLNAPEAEGEPHLTYIIGPGEVEHQLRNQASHGKGETTTRTKDLKPKAKPKKKEAYIAPKEREREQDLISQERDFASEEGVGIMGKKFNDDDADANFVSAPAVSRPVVT